MHAIIKSVSRITSISYYWNSFELAMVSNGSRMPEMDTLYQSNGMLSIAGYWFSTIVFLVNSHLRDAL